MKTMACKDTGIPCDFIALGRTYEEVIKQVIEHTSKEHGHYMMIMKKYMSPEGIRRVLKAMIKTAGFKSKAYF